MTLTAISLDRVFGSADVSRSAVGTSRVNSKDLRAVLPATVPYKAETAGTVGAYTCARSWCEAAPRASSARSTFAIAAPLPPFRCGAVSKLASPNASLVVLSVPLSCLRSCVTRSLRRHLCMMGRSINA